MNAFDLKKEIAHLSNSISRAVRSSDIDSLNPIVSELVSVFERYENNGIDTAGAKYEISERLAGMGNDMYELDQDILKLLLHNFPKLTYYFFDRRNHMSGCASKDERGLSNYLLMKDACLKNSSNERPFLNTIKSIENRGDEGNRIKEMSLITKYLNNFSDNLNFYIEVKNTIPKLLKQCINKDETAECGVVIDDIVHYLVTMCYEINKSYRIDECDVISIAKYGFLKPAKRIVESSMLVPSTHLVYIELASEYGIHFNQTSWSALHREIEQANARKGGIGGDVSTFDSTEITAVLAYKLHEGHLDGYREILATSLNCFRSDIDWVGTVLDDATYKGLKNIPTQQAREAFCVALLERAKETTSIIGLLSSTKTSAVHEASKYIGRHAGRGIIEKLSLNHEDKSSLIHAQFDL